MMMFLPERQLAYSILVESAITFLVSFELRSSYSILENVVFATGKLLLMG